MLYRRTGGEWTGYMPAQADRLRPCPAGAIPRRLGRPRSLSCARIVSTRCRSCPSPWRAEKQVRGRASALPRPGWNRRPPASERPARLAAVQ